MKEHAAAPLATKLGLVLIEMRRHHPNFTVQVDTTLRQSRITVTVISTVRKLTGTHPLRLQVEWDAAELVALSHADIASQLAVAVTRHAAQVEALIHAPEEQP